MDFKKTSIVLVLLVITTLVLCKLFVYKPEIKKKAPKSLMSSILKTPQLCMYSNAFTMPNDADLTKVVNHGDTVLLQNIADTTAWKTFIAISWPSLSSGQPDTSACLGTYHNKITVWEHWKEINDVITKSGVKVSTNNGDSVWVPDGCFKKYQTLKDKENTLLLYKTSLPGSASTINKRGLKLVDQDTNLTYFQIYYNHRMVDYIQKSQLDTYEGQQLFVNQWPQFDYGVKLLNNNKVQPFELVFFPLSVREDSVVTSLNYKLVYKQNNNGSVMLKVAWKVLSPNDDASKFYTRNALIAVGKDSCFEAKVGLVGLHVVRKTAESPQWIWSSFEHAYNVPDLDSVGKPVVQAGVKYSYFNSNCTDCPINKADTVWPFAPSQVARALPVPKYIKGINSHFHGLMSSSSSNNVWLNYKLVGTQWPFAPDLLSEVLLPIYPLSPATPRPTLFSNPVFETYHQKSSCMSCHADAFMLKKIPTDFVWGLIKAKKKVQ